MRLILISILFLAACTSVPAHKDCERKLVPINGHVAGTAGTDATDPGETGTR